MKAEKSGGVRWSFAGMQVFALNALVVPVCLPPHIVSQDVLGAMSPPPAPMFMPHGSLLDSPSEDLPSPAAARGSFDEVPSPVGPHRFGFFPFKSLVMVYFGK